MSERDKMLVAQAKHQDWGKIDEDAAETEEGRIALHDIIRYKALREEYLSGML